MVTKIIKARIEMNDGGVMSLELYPEYAPETVANFVELCNAKFYDGLCFHRVIPNFMVQAGGFAWNNGLVEKRAKKTVRGEFKSNGVNNTLLHKAGVISMARTSVPDSASSQFFICVADTPFLDGEYAAFGRVTDSSSLDVAVAISKERRGSWSFYDDVPFSPQVIKSVRIIEQ